MTNQELEQRIANAVERSTPDVLDAVLLQIHGERFRGDLPAQPVDPSVYAFPTAKARSRGASRWAGLAAALLLVVFGGWFGYGNFAVHTVVSLDINPSIELRLNRFERVLSATPLNDDAAAVLEEIDIKNTGLDEAVNVIVGSMVDNGYLSESDNAILITVESGSAERTVHIQERLTEEVNACLVENQVEGAIISHAMMEDSALTELAEDLDISAGKAALVSMIVDLDDTLDFAEIAELPISDIHLILSSQEEEFDNITYIGNANVNRYIGEDEAVAIALGHAQVGAQDASAMHTRMHYSGGIMVYRIEFTADSQYVCQVDATTGEVLDLEKEYAFTDYMSEDEALQTVLSHAGIRRRDVETANIIFRESETAYTINLRTADATYSYKIHAATGEVLSESSTPIEPSSESSQRPAEPQPEPSEAESQPDPVEASEPETSEPPAPVAISEAEAKTIALQHAGVDTVNASFVQALQYTRQGVSGYYLVFLSGTNAHIYQIELYTGAVLANNAYPYQGGDWSEFLYENREETPPASSGGAPDGDASSQAPDDPAPEYISEARARSIALAHAGIPEAGVTRLESTMSSGSGGVMVFEIAFHFEDERYAYTIDAVTGDILHWDIG